MFLLYVLGFDPPSPPSHLYVSYDHVITIDQEVERIWKAPWSLPKVLFLFVCLLALDCKKPVFNPKTEQVYRTHITTVSPLPLLNQYMMLTLCHLGSKSEHRWYADFFWGNQFALILLFSIHK